MNLNSQTCSKNSEARSTRYCRREASRFCSEVATRKIGRRIETSHPAERNCFLLPVLILGRNEPRGELARAGVAKAVSAGG